MVAEQKARLDGMETDKREHRRGGARLQHTASGPSRKEPGKPRKNRSKGPKKPWKQLRTQEKVLRVLLIVAAVLAAVLLAAVLLTALIGSRGSVMRLLPRRRQQPPTASHLNGRFQP